MGVICSSQQYAEPNEDLEQPQQPPQQSDHQIGQDAKANENASQPATVDIIQQFGDHNAVYTILEEPSVPLDTKITHEALETLDLSPSECTKDSGDSSKQQLTYTTFIQKLSERLTLQEMEEDVKQFQQSNPNCKVYRGWVFRFIVWQHGSAYVLTGDGLTASFKNVEMHRFKNFHDHEVAHHLLNYTLSQQIPSSMVMRLKFLVEQLSCRCAQVSTCFGSALENACPRCMFRNIYQAREYTELIRKCFDLSFMLNCKQLLKLMPDFLVAAGIPSVFIDAALNERYEVQEAYNSFQHQSIKGDKLIKHKVQGVSKKRPVARENITGLMIASAHNRTKMVEFLLPFEAGVKSEKGETALGIAINRGHKKCAQPLALYMAEQQAIGLTELMRATFGADLTGIARFNAQVGKRDAMGNLALHYAVFSSSLPTLSALNDLEGKGQLDLRNSAGITPLMLATHTDLEGALQVLVAREDQLPIKDKQGLTALLHAIQSQKEEAAQLLFPHYSREERNKALLECILLLNSKLAHRLDPSLLELQSDGPSSAFALDTGTAVTTEYSEALYSGLQLIQRTYSGWERRQMLAKLASTYNKQYSYRGFLVEFCADTTDGTIVLASNVIRLRQGLLKGVNKTELSDAWIISQLQNTTSTIPRDLWNLFVLFDTPHISYCTDGLRKQKNWEEAVHVGCPACFLQSINAGFGLAEFHRCIHICLQEATVGCLSVLLKQAEPLSYTGITKTMVWAAFGDAAPVDQGIVFNQAEIGRQDRLGMTALMFASHAADVCRAKALLSELQLVDTSGRGALWYCVWGRGSLQRRRQLATMLCDAFNDSADAELYSGLTEGLVRAFLDGVSTEDVDLDGKTAQDYAALGGRFLPGERWAEAVSLAAMRGMERICIEAVRYAWREGFVLQDVLLQLLLQHRAYRAIAVLRAELVGEFGRRLFSVVEKDVIARQLLFPVGFRGFDSLLNGGKKAQKLSARDALAVEGFNRVVCSEVQTVVQTVATASRKMWPVEKARARGIGEKQADLNALFPCVSSTSATKQ